jgi:uncharacterized repeat protein (TIGR03803 family)
MHKTHLGTMIGTLSAIWLLFSVTTPAHAGSEKTVYAFTSIKEGYSADGALTRLGGRFYGMTSAGGKSGMGTVFSVTKKGKHHIEHDFAGGSDGSAPYHSLLDAGGTLYGTTNFGGDPACDCGTVFSLTPNGVYTQIYAFKGGSDGAAPGDLTLLNGVMYGTTSGGGASQTNCNCGTIFSITPLGVEQVIYTFQGGADGSGPTGLFASGTALYGMTTQGGNNGCHNASGTGCGTVYSVTPGGVKTVLHIFDNPKDGILPRGKPVVVGDVIYGNTTFGGVSTACGDSGCGTVFRLTLAGAYKSLYKFALADGDQPQAGLIDRNGLLYGTTIAGGPSGHGEVFSISRQGALTILYGFKGRSDGSEPSGDLIEDDGAFYGLTSAGGVTTRRKCPLAGCGTIFEVQP